LLGGWNTFNMMGTKVSKQPFHYKSTEHRAIGRTRNRAIVHVFAEMMAVNVLVVVVIVVAAAAAVIAVIIIIIIIIIIISQDKISTV